MNSSLSHPRTYAQQQARRHKKIATDRKRFVGLVLLAALVFLLLG